MKKFRKKPVECECWLWDETQATLKELLDAGMKITACTKVFDGSVSRAYGLHIDTLEGAMFATPGCWIVKGVKDEFWPVQADIFAMTYEEVVE